MATISEDYVSFETAKLLKEKGFDEACDKKYFGDDCSGPSYIRERWEDGGEVCPMSNSDLDDGSKYADISAPTLQMAIKWFEKVHNIHIAVVPCEVSPGVMDYTYILYKVDAENFIFKDLGIQGRADTDKMSAPKTYEAAIKYCSENLI